MAPRKKEPGASRNDGKRKSKPKPPRRQAGKGSYFKDGDGYRLAITVKGRTIRERAPTEAAILARLDELAALKAQQIDVGSGAQQLSSWMEAWYALRQASETLKPRTLMHYRSLIERYITPMLGGLRLDAVTPDLIQAFIFAVRDQTRAKYETLNQQRKADGKALRRAHNGIKTARDCGMVLKLAFQLAVDRKVLAESPYRGIQLPKPPARPVKPLSLDQLVQQLRAFVVVAREHPLAPLWYSYVLLGLRAGEGLGIAWRNVDVATATLCIDQQVQAIARAGDVPMYLTIGSPKSAAGERYLPLPRVLVAMYQAHHAAYLERRAERATTWQGDEYHLAFCTRDGAPLWPRNLDDDYRVLRERAGLPASFTLHQLRHAVASLLDTLPGITESTKAEILGHKKATITLAYTHGGDEAKRRVLEALAQLILGDDEQECPV